VPLSEPHSRVEGRRHRAVSSVRDPGDNASGTSSARVLSTRTAATCHNTWPRAVTRRGTSDVAASRRALAWTPARRSALNDVARQVAGVGGMGYDRGRDGGMRPVRRTHTGRGRSRVRFPQWRKRAAHHAPRSRSALPVRSHRFCIVYIRGTTSCGAASWDRATRICGSPCRINPETTRQRAATVRQRAETMRPYSCRQRVMSRERRRWGYQLAIRYPYH